MTELRIVVDTNIWISYLFFARATVADAGDFLVSDACTVVASGPLLDELRRVLSGARWDPYLSLETRMEFYRGIHGMSEIIVPTSAVTACRDFKDNMLLEAAHDGRAGFLISGDRDLLDLADHPDPDWTFRIVSPAEFLKAIGEAA